MDLEGTIILDDGRTLHLKKIQNSAEPIYFKNTFNLIKLELTKKLSETKSHQQQIQEIKFHIKNKNHTHSLPEMQMEEIDFFHHLLKETEIAFQISATKEKHPESNWNFAICDTPIQKKCGLFFGLNWGGDNIDQQTVYPPKYKDRNWKFISASRQFFREYLSSEIEDLNYSNLCFFRSPNLNKFVSSDWKLGIPLFKKYTEYINPPFCLMLGDPEKLSSNNHIKDLKTHEIVDEKTKRRVYGFSGQLFGKYPFGSVPHPESQISTSARNSIWQIVTSEIKKSML